MLLIEAAEAGNEKEVEECAVVFTEHAAKLEEVRERLLTFRRRDIMMAYREYIECLCLQFLCTFYCELQSSELFVSCLF